MSLLAFLAHLRARPRISFARRLLGLIALRRSRRALGHLDARLMRDIGVDAIEARTEAARPTWDAPEHWFDRRGPF